MMKIQRLILGYLFTGLVLSACSPASSKNEVNANNLASAGLTTNQQIDMNGSSVRVMSRKVFADQNALTADTGPTAPTGITAPTGGATAPTGSVDQQSLLIEMPLQLLKDYYVFGGVVTGVSVSDDVVMGGLKTANFPETITKLDYDSVNQALVISGCKGICGESSEYLPLYSIPVLKEDKDKKTITLDFSQLTNELDIVLPWVAENGLPEKHVKLGSTVQMVDYSFNTLVFEIQTQYNRQLDKNPYNYTTKTRWYLKTTSSFNPAFVSRAPVKEAGFFQTNYEADFARITRYSLDKPVKFYLKDIPQRYRQAFADALEDWNIKLAPILKKPVIQYEFIEKTDPRYNLIVAGDIRFSVIQWDFENIAGYGGLGPSYANPVTGQTFSSVVLIQGPTIEKLYTNWFLMAAKAKAESDTGVSTTQDEAILAYSRSLRDVKNLDIKPFKPRTNSPFTFPAIKPELHDPITLSEEFYLPPENISYDQYMYGYFRDMVSHEVGHNLGLRHNFRGNLASDDSGDIGTASRSVMEYLGRSFRYIDRVGEYDVMAINYGYLGVKPNHSDWFCTDEDQFSADTPNNSAECSSNDATSDPYSFFEGNLAKVYNLLVAPDLTTASSWRISDVTSNMQIAVDGLASYAISAPATAATWTNFFGKFDRPKKDDIVSVPSYILARIKAQVCNANEEKLIAAKTSAPDQEATRKNIQDFKAAFKKMTASYKKPYDVFNTELFDCLQNVK